jgi:hypothetical protein
MDVSLTEDPMLFEDMATAALEDVPLPAPAAPPPAAEPSVDLIDMSDLEDFEDITLTLQQTAGLQPPEPIATPADADLTMTDTLRLDETQDTTLATPREGAADPGMTEVVSELAGDELLDTELELELDALDEGQRDVAAETELLIDLNNLNLNDDDEEDKPRPPERT